MRNYFKIKLNYIIILLFIINSCAQNSKTKLIENINNDIEAIESIIESTNEKFAISPSFENNFDETNENNFIYHLTEKKTINKEKVKQYFDSLNVGIKTSYPYNLILNIGASEMIKLIETFNINTFNPNQLPTIVPVTISYINGSTQNIGNNYLSKQKIIDKYKSKEFENTEKLTPIEEEVLNGGADFAIKNSKPIKNVTFDAIFPKIETTILSKPNESIENQFGAIYLYGISGQTVTVDYPTKLEEEDNIEIRGVYKDGRILSTNGSSAIKIISKKKLKKYQEYLKLLGEIKEKLQNGDIETQEQLESIITKHSQKIDKLEKYTRKTFYFSGPVDKANIRIVKKNGKKEVYTFTSKVYYYRDNYRIAEDLMSKKYGVIDDNGNWISEPKFNSTFSSRNKHYFEERILKDAYTYEHKLFHLNPLNGEFKKIESYQLANGHNQIYQDKYVIIENKGFKGIANAITGEISTEIKYKNIYFINGEFKFSE